jgi:hypothetical protein
MRPGENAGRQKTAQKWTMQSGEIRPAFSKGKPFFSALILSFCNALSRALFKLAPLLASPAR